MWFIGVEVEQETSAPPPKKILDPPLDWQYHQPKAVVMLYATFKLKKKQSKSTLVHNL